MMTLVLDTLVLPWLLKKVSSLYHSTIGLGVPRDEQVISTSSPGLTVALFGDTETDTGTITAKRASLVSIGPTKFVAMHVYTSLSSSVIFATLRSPLGSICILSRSRLLTGIEPLRQLMTGAGRPVARQRNNTSVPTYATEWIKHFNIRKNVLPFNYMKRQSEQFTIECLKTRTKVITVVNSNDTDIKWKTKTRWKTMQPEKRGQTRATESRLTWLWQIGASF